MEKKKIRNDLILIFVILALCIGAIVIVLLNRRKDNLVAKVYVRNDVVEVIDLSIKEERLYEIEGTEGHLTISAKNGGVAVIHSDCPHQDCVHMGYVYETNHPIICAHNGVYIIIVGKAFNDVEAG